MKTGYFRIQNEETQNIRILSYSEYLNYGEDYQNRLKAQFQNGKIKLYCACCAENKLELSITENAVIRVKTNHQQELHKQSCPKSMYYQNWVNTAKKGVFLLGSEGEMIFNITMPAVYSNSHSGGSSSSSNSTSSLAHTTLLSMITTFNALAWEKQTFSIKKKIGLARKNNEPIEWTYKSAEDFLRLMYGVSNDIQVKNGNNYLSFRELLYHKEAYFSNTDYKTRYFIFAEVLKQGEYKEDRKYQYVTVALHSQNSNKTAVRIPTEMYQELFMNTPEEEGCKRYLSGYVYRKTYQDSDWMTLLKGFVVYTSLNGLYAETPEVARVFNYLAEKKIIFKRCYQPIESYGGYIPTIIIEKLHEKNIIVDFVGSKQMRSKRSSYIDNNEEYTIYTLTYDELFPDQIYDLVFQRP